VRNTPRPDALHTTARAAWALTKFSALVGEHFGGLTGLLFGGIFALPLAIGALLLGGFLCLVLISFFFAIIIATFGETLGTLLSLLIIGAALYLIYRLIASRIQRKLKQHFLENYLPYLNDYKNFPAQYNPRHLTNPHKTQLEKDTTALANIILTQTDPQTLHALKLTPEAQPRHILAKITFSPDHFNHLTLKQIKTTLPKPQDLDRLEEQLANQVQQEIQKQGGTILGQQFTSTPPLFHTQQDAAIHIDLENRFKHAYLIGKTGAGKSNLLKHIIIQDLHQQDRGVIVLSPEDGIFQTLLASIPDNRKDDLIYFDPTDLSSPIIGFNCFDFSEAKDLSQQERESYLTQRAGETYTIFERALGDLGVKMSTLMQNVAYALLQLPDTTILDFDPLLDPKNNTLRDALLNAPDVDQRTKRFWEQYADQTYYTSTYAPVINRLEPFFRPPLSITLSTPSFTFAEALNGTQPRIIFLNLSKLRGVQAQILGQLCIATIQQTLLRREQISEQNRLPYMFYIDEFSMFTTSEQSFIDLFERARKYKMGVTLAHQVIADLPPKAPRCSRRQRSNHDNPHPWSWRRSLLRPRAPTHRAR